MSVFYCKKTRRQFLLGGGKSLLALPFLPSLLPREAWAQAAVAPKKMMLFWFDHCNLNSMWPATSAATTAIGSSGARETLLTSLGTMASHSPAMNNARFESYKNSNLITIARGFDLSHYGAHGNGGLAAAQNGASEGNFPTIDTIVEASSSVYPLTTPVSVRRVIRISPNASDFYRKVGGTIERLPVYGSSDLRRFYNEVLSSLTGETVPVTDFSNQLKSNILNRVHTSYSTFRNTTRISSDDRARVEQHMDYISDLQRSFASLPVPQPAACVRPNDPGDVSNPLMYYGLYMDLLAVAFKCGLTKFGVMRFEGHDPRWIPNLNTEGLNMHDVMHGAGGNVTLQRDVKINWWRHFSNLIADRFLIHLEQQEGDTGRSYLENMITGLICHGGFANPGGDGGHNGRDSQQILIGSMGGQLRSGRYMTVPRGSAGNLPYNCFLITLLQLMGVPPSEYAFATDDGLGIGFYGAFSSTHPYRSRFYQPVTELLV